MALAARTTVMPDWPLASLSALDTAPGGRYTQIRDAGGPSAPPLVVWNSNGGESTPPGLRLVRCLSADCRLRNVTSVAGVDGDPRFVRMELAPDAPLLAFVAANSTELHLVRCRDVRCAAGRSTRRLGAPVHK
eukprot:5726691-Prymnesium_polylepis.1